MVFFFPWAVVFGKLNALATPAVASLPPEQRAPLVEALIPGAPANTLIEPGVANQFAWLTFVDILIFFAVLMVGFAYLWKRGDLNWVRSTAAEQSKEEPDMEKYAAEYQAAMAPEPPATPAAAPAH
jgi:NADH-quinone oxidoreductase subunit A